jgi:nicotinamide-nucleotide adenylyltransferase
MKVPIHFSQQAIQRFKQAQALLDQLRPESPPQALILPGSPQPTGNIIVFPGSFNPPTNAHLALLKEAQQFAHSPTFLANGENPGGGPQEIGEGPQGIEGRGNEGNEGNEGRAQGIAPTMDVLLYAAISKRTTDKENVDRPLMLDRIALLDTLLKRRLPHTGIMLFNRGLYVELAEAVRASFPEVKRLFFLLGFDKIVQILDSHYYEDRNAALKTLFSLAELLVAPRGSATTRDEGDGQGRGRPQGIAPTMDENALSDLLGQPQNQPFAAYIHALPLSSAYRDVSSSRIRQHGAEYLQDVPEEVRRFMRETHAYDFPTRLEDGNDRATTRDRRGTTRERLYHGRIGGGRDQTEVDYYEERVKALKELLQ